MSTFIKNRSLITIKSFTKPFHNTSFNRSLCHFDKSFSTSLNKSLNRFDKPFDKSFDKFFNTKVFDKFDKSFEKLEKSFEKSFEKMSFYPYFHHIRQDLFQLFSDIERDLGLESWPATETGRRQLLESEQAQARQPITSGAGVGTQQQQQQGTTMVAGQPQGTQLSTNVDFSKPLAANFKISDEGDKYVATGEFPGVRPEDLHVSVHDGMITLNAHRDVAKEGRNISPDNTMKSYSYSSKSERVARTIPLPAGVNANNVQTNFNNGFLRLELGKSPEALQSDQQTKAAEKQQQQQSFQSQQAQQSSNMGQTR